MTKTEIIKLLTDNGLKITPQRTDVLEAVIKLKNHPNAENIIDLVKANNPNISAATIYKTLDTFVTKGIIRKVATSNEIMRYDAIHTRHHHLYCAESDRIEDFYDDNLNRILEDYFKGKKIPNFKVEDIKLQIVGKFTDNNINKKENKKK